ncbi:hypothetical protein ALC56_15262 [Trachymyrmex septentrionalis]|uniref:Uncharacterized protein n=1 Tax=Trachymyrmex septentrionalis TaxID=34720 RepID=A0A195EQW4_9HYME|nr:hypothetical protein ALC56_15262 [Trachymyrmex septentrionalis]
MHRTVGVRSALLTARSSAAVATVATDRRPTRPVTFELSRGFDDDNCCRAGNRIRHETFFSPVCIFVVVTTADPSSYTPTFRHRRSFFPEPQESDSIGQKREREREREREIKRRASERRGRGREATGQYHGSCTCPTLPPARSLRTTPASARRRTVGEGTTAAATPPSASSSCAVPVPPHH